MFVIRQLSDQLVLSLPRALTPSWRVGWCLPPHFPGLCRVVINLKLSEAPSHYSSECHRKAQKETNSSAGGRFEQVASHAGSEQRQLHIKTVRFHIAWPFFISQAAFFALPAPFPALRPQEKRGVSAFSPGPGSRARAALAAGRSGLPVTTASSEGVFGAPGLPQEALQKVGRM